MEEEIVLMEENDIEEINIEEENYSGKPYELPIASKDVLGGIKVGENLTIDEDGTLNATGGGVVAEEKEIINIGLSADYNHTLSAGWIRQAIPFDKVTSSIGNGLSLTSEGRIKIGKGISKISINACALVYRTGSVGTSDIGIRLLRNGVYTTVSLAYHWLSKVKDYQTINNLVPLYDVQEGDEIELSYTSPTSDTFRYSYAGTFLSVEKVA